MAYVPGDQRRPRPADLPPAAAVPRPVGVRPAQPRLPRGPRLPRRARACSSLGQQGNATVDVRLPDEVGAHLQALRRRALQRRGLDVPRLRHLARRRRDRQPHLPHRERRHPARRAHHRERRGAPAAGLRAADHLRVGGARSRLDVRRGAAADADGEIVRLAYGPGATITRLNKGLRRRANRTQLGFKIDPVSGYWAKNEDEGDEPGRSDDLATAVDRPQRAGPQERAPAPADGATSLAVHPRHPPARAPARHRGRLPAREGEILAEPMPTRDARTGFLLYEATEGGAGVLTRLVADPSASPRSPARRWPSCTSP
jgi:hypothetical protein